MTKQTITLHDTEWDMGVAEEKIIFVEQNYCNNMQDTCM